MKLIILLFNSFLAFTVLDHPELPAKLRLYQNVTGISDTQLLDIYERSLKQGRAKYPKSFVKF